jgi:hypothetical protein
MPSNRDEWLALVACSWGGKAAVEVAIDRMVLRVAPPGIEIDHGDHGFYGDDNSDHACACEHSASAQAAGFTNDWKSFYAEGHAAAREVIEANFMKIESLVGYLMKKQVLTGAETLVILKPV